ncbi:MAG: FHA domain-containing protein, partial [Verrucomicrobiota bacterium]|nr:FHA domain-containing protein [Verrucomicrobiota bacterium]
MAFAHKLSLGVINCLNGEFKQASSSPFVIGSGSDSDLVIQDDSVLDQHCLIEKTKKGIQIRSIQSDHPDGSLILDGKTATLSPLKARTEHSLQIGRSFLILVTTLTSKKENLQRWGMDIGNGGWIINKSNKAAATRPLDILEVFSARDTMELDPNSTPVFKGSSQVGFYLSQLMVLEPEKDNLPDDSISDSDEELVADRVDEVSESSPSMARFVDADAGEFTCPTCWLKFDRGDVMHVAVHDSLFGDPLLGEEQMQRFHASRFNDRGQALDEYGIPCTEIACPHCRRTLPPGFFDEPHKIFSIVGAPQSGKSYYLTVVIKLLQTTLLPKFGVVFRDADPAGNAPINEMKSHLFSAQTSSQAYLTKTQLEGAMYERLPRYDRMVTLPKPFIFSLSGSESDEENCSVVFYDNAGEHFQPGQDSTNSPGAQHIASSDAIFFLFDPTINPDFRRSLADSDDPQFKSQVSDQQDVILAETEVRIKKLLGLGRREKVDIPLSIIIGKCDSWIHKIGKDKLRDPIV